MDLKINSIMKTGVTRYAETVRKPAKAATFSQGTDKVDFSESGRLFASALKAAKDAQPVRSELVQSIKERVDNGTYQVDSSAIAAKMLGRLAES